MKITETEIRRIARLASLEPDLKLGRDLNAILDYMDRLAAVDTAGVEPSYSALSTAGELRADSPRPSLLNALAGCAELSAGAVVVPRVLE